MIKIKTNIPSVKRGLQDIMPWIQATTPKFFRDHKDKIRQQGREIVAQVVYAAFPEGKSYVRRGTSTGSLGILNSIATMLNQSGDGMVLGITTGSSTIADTIPKTSKGRAVADTYAVFMITGGGFLKPLGTDVRDFLDVWTRFFEITLPYKYLKDVVNPAVMRVL